jgi:ribose 5-phosphate isomerase B
MIAGDLGGERVHALLDFLRGNERLHALSPEVRKGNIASLVKRFQMVTEADARVLDYGSTIVLVSGGHITPLAHDTLKARRITVVREGADPEAAALAPPAEIRTVAIAGDHSAVGLKAALVQHLRGRGLAVHDLGTATSDPVDYPDTAAAAAIAVARGEADAAIVIDGAGLGSTIAANKVAGARAAMCLNETLARYARQHNGANVLALGATLVTREQATAIVDTFIETPMREPRYIRRLAKIRDLEMRPRG